MSTRFGEAIPEESQLPERRLITKGNILGVIATFIVCVAVFPVSTSLRQIRYDEEQMNNLNSPAVAPVPAPLMIFVDTIIPSTTEDAQRLPLVAHLPGNALPTTVLVQTPAFQE